MKLKEWAEQTGIKYLTAYRWFKAGTLPVKAYQTESGTILVEEENTNSTTQIATDKSADATSLFLKKTLEFSKNSSSIEDFAAYLFSNFNLSLKETEEKPRYSKNKPKPEDIQNYFKKLLPVRGEKPKPNMYIPEPDIIEGFVTKEEPTTLAISGSPTVSEEINSLTSNYSTLLSNVNVGSSFDTSDIGAASVLSPAVSFSKSPELASLSFDARGLSLSDGDSSNIMCSTNGMLPQSGIYYTSNHIDTQSFGLDKPKRGRPKKVKE